MLKAIANQTAACGGRLFYVGGYVRDLYLPQTVQIKKEADIDIEVFGLQDEQLLDILSRFGMVNKVGKSFSIYKIRGYHQLDFSLNPVYDLKAAVNRRDFTINAMMQDVLTGELFDPLGGMDDIGKRLIRPVHNSSITDDPLRAWRAVQLAARFGFYLDTNAIQQIQAADIMSIAPERIFNELGKLLLNSSQPSIGLRYLADTKILERRHPKLAALINCAQTAATHPEGDVWEHTLLVVDEAAKIKNESKNPEALMWAALLHDIGKPKVSRRQGEKITAYGHDVVGATMAGQFLPDLKAGNSLTREVSVLVREHMHPVLLYKDRERVSNKAIARLANRVDTEELLLLAQADFAGRGGGRRAEDFAPIYNWLTERLCQLGLKPGDQLEPLVQGKDLVELGFTPGRQFKKLLDGAMDQQLEGLNREQILLNLQCSLPDRP
ncbi:MAG: CCA tRNA nucleotidyltransferase [Syntrophomonadaceae bacterium]|mgnify:CR=1 FL=1|jgi:tRNA nucleotidyltransferase (CCA-adding enzyme)